MWQRGACCWGVLPWLALAPAPPHPVVCVLRPVPCAHPCRLLVMQHGGRCGVLDTQPLIFMRWKEQFFVDQQADCGLTIAGARCWGCRLCWAGCQGWCRCTHSAPA
jgi:hypothetical protein